MRPVIAMSFFSSLVLAAPAPAQPAGQSIDAFFAKTCAMCHGADANGGLAPSLLTGNRMDPADAANDRKYFETIKNGRLDNGMPAFGVAMSDEQIWSAVVYIRELQHQARRKTDTAEKFKTPEIASKYATYAIKPVIDSGLEFPWSIDFLPAAGNAAPPILVTEKSGRLRIFDNGKLSDPIKGTPAVRDRGQGGLMDVAVHPDYAKTGWVYLAYSDLLEPSDGPQAGKSLGMTKIVRGRIKDGAWVDQQTIFEAKKEHYLPTDLHFGCRIVFDHPKGNAPREGYLFFGIGERGHGNLAQDLTRPNGKIYRVRDDGTIPPDNPFVDSKELKAAGKEAYGQIWSYGHRNPQGLVIDLDGNLWDTEHGPRGGDELNLIKPGANYGWPVISFGMEYSGMPLKTPWPPEGSNYVMPVYRWLPSIAACGLDVVRGDAFPQWKNDLVAGGLAGQTVERLRVKDGVLTEREEILFGLGRVRDVVCGPEGAIYIVLNQPDKVIKLVPAGPASAPPAPHQN